MTVSILKDFPVNTTTSNFQFTPAVTALTGGRFLVTWSSSSASDVSSDIRARIYNADGTAVGPDAIVNSSSLGSQNFPSVTTLSDGRFVFAWESFPTARNSNITAHIYNADGTTSGDDFVANTTDAVSERLPTITALTGGRFVVSWDSETTSRDFDVRARIYGADGKPVAKDFQVNTTTAESQQNSTVEGLTDGRFVVAWESHAGISTDPEIRARIYGANGKAVGTDFVVNSSPTYEMAAPAVSALSGGRFVVTWDSSEISTGNDIRGRIYKADGTPAAKDFRVSQATAVDHYTSQVTDLADGRFAVVWQSREATGPGLDVRARIFLGDGTVAGNEFIVNSSTKGDQIDVSAAALSDGRLAVSWYSNGVDAYGDIAATIINPLKYTGTNAAETWRGGNFADRIYGLGGNDKLYGGSGKDLLVGGKGADTLNGGKGSDSYSYTATNEGGDTIASFTSADQLRFKAAAFGFVKTGSIAADQFHVVTKGHAAGDAEDRFIFNTTDDTLWADIDGAKGPAKAVLNADFTASGHDVVVEDFWIV